MPIDYFFLLKVELPIESNGEFASKSIGCYGPET